MDRFVDDFSVLAIEQCLLKRLPCLFTAEVVDGLELGELRSLAAEEPVAESRREHYKANLTILEHALRRLTSIERFRPKVLGKTHLPTLNA